MPLASGPKLRPTSWLILQSHGNPANLTRGTRNGDAERSYWDSQAVIPRPQQEEGTLHELIHAGHEVRLAAHADESYTLAYQVAIYGFLPRHTALVLGCTPETMDFLRGYYDGVGEWPGMYQIDRNKPKVRVMDFMRRRVDMSQVNVRELMAGLGSYTMGQINEGPRRLPNTMRWLFNWLFTGEIQATPYYEPT